jgi:hypothetical protein
MCGPGHVEVRKVGIAGVNRYWIVGEVFGRHHHSSSRYPQADGMTLDEAQVLAERVAADMIAGFKRSPLNRVPNGARTLIRTQTTWMKP